MSATAIIAAVAAAAKAGVEVWPIVQSLVETFKPGAPEPTQADWDRMAALEASLSARIQKPLPAEEA